MRLRALLLAAAAGVATSAGASEPVTVTVRSTQHRGIGRLVFDFPPGLHWHESTQGERIVLRFDAPAQLRSPAELPRSVLTVAEEGDSAATVQLAAGVRARTRQRRQRLVIEARDPPRTATPPAVPTAAPAPPTEAPRSETSQPAGLTPPPTPPTRGGESSSPPPLVRGGRGEGSTGEGSTSALLAPSPQAPPSPAIAPAALAVAVQREAAPDTGQASAAIVLPFDAGVGAAALTRGDVTLVVFDLPKPLDMAALHNDAMFSSASVTLLPTATLLQVRAPSGGSVALTREPGGWRLAVGSGQEPPRPIAVTETGGTLLLGAVRPGRVVALTDPLSGGTLLVGTQLEGGQAALTARQTPEFALLRTLQGVAVEPLSDRLQLDPVKEGFRLAAVGGPLALAPELLPDALLARAATLTRRFELPTMPPEALRRRLDAQLATAADAPPLARGRLRVAAARTMLALGLDREAAGALRTAAADDPRLADDPEVLGLQGVAALLAHRPEEADGLLDKRLSGTDEVALWRALRTAMTAPTPETADVLAATAPLLLTYPEAVRNPVLALALETMADAGQAKAVAPFLTARPDDRRLALARAMAMQAEGKSADALARYDALVAGPDRLARLRAAMRAIDVRLAQKQITPAEGAERLEQLEDAWRGDRYELARRERLAELRLQSGAWRPALALLRESAARFPDAAPALRARMGEAVARLLRDDATRSMPPLDFVALLEENADLLGQAATGPDLQAQLADRLLALDLPDAAAPLLERVMRAAPPDAARGAIGAKLATLRLAAGDASGALAALSDSQAPDLPPPLAERRALLSAEGTARMGDPAQAAAQLAALGTPEAERARADILERAGDFPGEVAALAALADKTVPAQGPLDEAAQQTLLRLAAAASHAGDQAALAGLRTRIAGRLAAGPSADTLRLLLAEPVRQVADLARAAKEATLAGTVAADLRAASFAPAPH